MFLSRRSSQMTQLFYKPWTCKLVGHVGVFHFIALILSGLKSASVAVCSDDSAFLSLFSSQGSNAAQPKRKFRTLHFAWS